VFQIIEEFETELDAFEAEQFWIQFFRSWDKNYGYNLTTGGEGSSGRIMSEATKDKIRAKATGRLHSKEAKNKMSEAGKLRTNSPGTRMAISTANKGRKLTAEQIIANSLRQRGELSPKAKLTNVQAVEIRELVKTHTIKEVAKMYGVSNSTISHIKNYRTYK
jgi:DNA-binding NarL/FixJ family response regulator